MKIDLKVEQRQALSLKQTLSVKILSLGSLELKEYIQQESLENPLIEPDNLSYCTPSRKENTCGFATDYLEALNGEEQTVSLTDHLLLQIKTSGKSQNFIKDCIKILAFVESSGYIYTSPKEISRLCKMPTGKVTEIIEFIKTLEPAGVGAQSLGECLYLQIEDKNSLEAKIAQNYLGLLAKGKFKEIEEQTGFSKEEIQKAAEKIRRLNPKPAQEYRQASQTVYIVPDIIVTEEKGKLTTRLAREKETEIFISSSYLQLLKTSNDLKTKEYLQNKLDKALWLKQCIESRNKTLLAIGREVVKKQKKFFLTGEKQYLKPLKQEDIAKELNVHISTISRGVKDKYIQYPFGMVLLKNIFMGGLSYGTEGSMATESIKEKIKNIIASEDKNFPLSDRKISELLKEIGIECSRRTIAKYRESMGILPSAQR